MFVRYQIHSYIHKLICLLIGGLIALLSLAIPTRAATTPSTGYQEYYVLGYEEHVWRAFRAIYDDGIPGQICSTISLIATADHQVIIYDHWEDGYERDLRNPTQATTEIYGDGDPTNGGEGSDILRAGDGIILTSDQDITGSTAITGYVPVDPARDPADLRYDGNDRILAIGGPVALTHAMWPLNASWAGGAWEVYPQKAYQDGYVYTIPIGQDLYAHNPTAYPDFIHVYLELGAFEDDTTVFIDNGSNTVVNRTLNQGESYSSMGYISSSQAPSITINAGTVIRSNKPVQVGLMTGGDNIGGFQGRFLVTLPDQHWGADYVVPVPSGDLHPAEIYLSNPNNFEITINAYDAGITTSFPISATGHVSATVPYSSMRGGPIPVGSAARFTSPQGVFGVFVCASTGDTDYDWGFSGVPTQDLVQDYYVSWAPGNYYCPGDRCSSYVNGSPVWVTPAADNTTFYADFSPLDGVVDVTFTLDVLQQRRIFDPDRDNTGMHVWATDKFAIAWGEDPLTAGPSNPYLDLGVATLPPLPRWHDAALTLDKSVHPAIIPPTGGSVTFTLVARSYETPLVNLGISDTLPGHWTYVPSSTCVTYPDGSAQGIEPSIDGQSLSWPLATDLGINQTLTLTFQARITDTSAVTISRNHGAVIGKHAHSDVFFNPTDEATVYISPLDLSKSAGQTQARVGDPLVYTLTYANVTSATIITGVTVQDVIPVQYVSFHSASTGGVYDPTSATIRWHIDTLNPGVSGTLVLTTTINDFVTDGTLIENVTTANSSSPAVVINSNKVRTKVIGPAITFRKSGPAAGIPGQVLTYILSYENLGGEQATTVLIQDTIPISTTYVTGSLAINTGSGWEPLTDADDTDQGSYHPSTRTVVVRPGSTPGSIAPQEAGQIRFDVRIDAEAPLGSPIPNWATLNRDLDSPRDSNLVLTRVADLLLNKAAAPTEVLPGDEIVYTLSYENGNALTQTRVYVREPIPNELDFVSGSVYGADQIEYSWDDGATWTPTLPPTRPTHIRWFDAELAPGVPVTVGFTARVIAATPPGAVIQNTAYITSAQSGAYTAQWIPSNQIAVTVAEQARCTLDKSLSTPAPPALAGDLLTYTLTVTNTGTAPTSNTFITDHLPTDTTFVTATTPHIGPTNRVITWPLGSLAIGDTRCVTLVIRAASDLPPGTVITNTAWAFDDQGIPSTDVITTPTSTAADLAVLKSVSPDPAPAGTPVTYTLFYSNPGPSDAQNVVITDTLPLSLTYGGVTAISPPLFGPTQTGRSLTWYTPTLPAGSSGAILFAATVHAGVSATLTNSVVITSTTTDLDPANNTTHEPLTVQDRAALSVTKTATPPARSSVSVGAPITYRVTVANTGLGYVDHVVITDAIPAHTELLTYTTSGGSITAASDTLTVTLERLWSDDGVTVTIVISTPLTLPDGTVIANQAFVKSTPVVTATNVVTHHIVSRPAFTLTKQSDGDQAPIGTPFTYTITLTNTGTSTATNLLVTDTLPAGAHYVSGGSFITSSSSVSWTVPAVAPGASTSLTFTVSTCQASLVNTAYQVITTTQGVTSPVGPPLLTLLMPPTLLARFSFDPPTVNVGNAVHFTDTSTTNGSPIQSWNWDFGDGGTGRGPTTTHIYTQGGVYTASLTVTDACGFTSTATGTVHALAPQLAIAKRATPTVVNAGDPLTYNITISNTGPGYADQVLLTDILPVGTSLITATPPYTGPINSTVTWPLDTLPAGATRAITIVVQVNSLVPAGDILTNTAQVTSRQGITASAVVTTLVETAADLAISKRDDPRVLIPGDPLTYTISFANVGPSDAQQVVITETLPISVTYGGIVDVTCSLFGPTRTGQHLTWYTPTLPAGALGRIIFTVTTNTDVVDPLVNHVSIASATPDPHPGNNKESELTGVYPRVDFQNSIFTVNEGAGTAIISVVLNAPVRITATVDYATADGTATAGADYSAVSGTLTFPPYTTLLTFTVPITDDIWAEPDETVLLSLTNPTSATLGSTNNPATLIILDDDPAYLSINSITVTEGHTATTDAIFTVSLSTPSALPVSVEYTTQDGTAVAPADYLSRTGTLTFTPGTLTLPITVPVQGDRVQEEDETFFVLLFNPVNATISTALGQATILDDDPANFAIIYGVVFEDGNGNGIQDTGEKGITGVTITLDGTVTTTTDLDGGYVFTVTTAGVHTVVETDLRTPNTALHHEPHAPLAPTDEPTYFSTTPNQVRVNVTLGFSHCVNFGDALSNVGFASVHGIVFEDINGDGIQNATEPGIPGVVIRLDNSTTTTTDLNGSYTFPITTVSIHVFTEENPTGYFSTTPDEVHLRTLPGRAYLVHFGDAPSASEFAVIYGTVFNDIDGDGIWARDELGISGVVITLDGQLTVTTDLYGSYTLFTTTPGPHTITETDPAGYSSTTPNNHIVDVELGAGYLVNFGDIEAYCAPDLYEEDDTFDLARTIIVGTLQYHQFCDDPIDWVKFTAKSSGVYTVTTIILGQRCDTILALFDTDGQTLLAENDDAVGRASRIVWQSPDDGIYYVRVTNKNDWTGPHTEYILQLEGQDPPQVIYLPIVTRNF